MINRIELLKAVSALSRFSASRSPSESYTKLCMSSPEGKLRLQCQSNCGTAAIHTDIEADIDAQVDYKSMFSILHRSSAGDVVITPGSKVRVQAGDRLDVELPGFSYTLSSITPNREEVAVSSAAWVEADEKVGVVGVELETKFASGVRILKEGDTVSFLMSTHNGMCGYTVEGAGEGELDVTVPVESIRAVTFALKMLGGDTVSLGRHNNWVYIKSGSFEASIPTVGGRPPHGKDIFKRICGDIVWPAPHAEMKEALRQAEVFCEAGSSGLDIYPSERGLHIAKHSVNDQGQVILESKGECNYLIPGLFSGPRIIIRREFLAAMIKNCDESYTMYASPNSVCVECGNYFAGYSCMTRGQR